MIIKLFTQKYSKYLRLEKSRTMLELAVQERAVELERQTGIAIQASRAKSQFLAAMSHEIRTPLNAVIGLSEIELRNKTPSSSLVADDLPTNLLVVQGLLEPYGLRVDTAASGREAIEMAKNHTYDIIFMDHMMPEMDGVETLTVIRKIDGYAHTPIIALTANALRNMREFYLEKGFQDYLSKPISPEALDEVINKWLREQGTMSSEQLAMNNDKTRQSFTPNSSLLTEIEAQRVDILNHYLVSFTCVPETDWSTKFDTAYFEKFTALIKSLNTPEKPAALREQQDLLAEAGRKEDARSIRETLPAFCGGLQKWREQAEGNEHTDKIPDEILPRLKNAILAGDTETAEAAINELGEAALTPASRELYFRLYALMLEGNTEKIMEAVEGVNKGDEA